MDGINFTDKAKRYTWILPVIWMGVIFMLSHQSGEESSGLSGGITGFMLNLARSLGIELDEMRFHSMIRVLGHFTEYFILGQLWHITLRFREIPPNQAAITAFSISLGYAVFDEIHQYFIPGRACEIADILVDAAGAGVASILGWLTGLAETKKVV